MKEYRSYEELAGDECPKCGAHHGWCIRYDNNVFLGELLCVMCGCGYSYIMHCKDSHGPIDIFMREPFTTGD